MVQRRDAAFRILNVLAAQVQAQTIRLTLLVWFANQESSLGTLVKKNTVKSLRGRKGIGLPERWFGFIAIEKGFIKADQLYEALMWQRAQETEGTERRLLGMILKDLGYLSHDQINEILQTLQREAEPREPTPESFK